jgi:hypothetical protein
MTERHLHGISLSGRPGSKLPGDQVAGWTIAFVVVALVGVVWLMIWGLTSRPEPSPPATDVPVVDSGTPLPEVTAAPSPSLSVESDYDHPGGDKIGAWVMAETFVKRGLKSPGTADFGGLFGEFQNSDDHVINLGDGRYRVHGWVDAQNSFGAKLRNYFTCEVEDKGNDKWTCNSLIFANP